MSAPDDLSLRPEIDSIRALLRKMGSDSPEERETVEAGIKGTARLVSALVQLVRLENDLHPADDNGVERSMEAIIDRAGRLFEERGSGHGTDA